jgi:hypothetical protein
MPKIQISKHKCAQNTIRKTQVYPKSKNKNTNVPKIQKSKHKYAQNAKRNTQVCPKYKKENTSMPKLGFSVAKYEHTSAIFSVLRRLQYK